MSAPQFLVVHAAPHPRPEVHRVGFSLDHPYVEMCWAEAIGPTATLFLRRLPELWRQSEPAVFEVAELARSLGLGHLAGGRRNKVWQTAERLTQFGLGAWGPGEGDLRVYSQVGPLGRRRLSRSSGTTQANHERLLEAHLRRLAAGERQAEAAGRSRAPGVQGPAQLAAWRATRASHPTVAEASGVRAGREVGGASAAAGWLMAGGPAGGGSSLPSGLDPEPGIEAGIEAGGGGVAAGGRAAVTRPPSPTDRLAARLDALQGPSLNPPTLGR